VILTLISAPPDKFGSFTSIGFYLPQQEEQFYFGAQKKNPPAEVVLL
jgi:hypothetical protein